MNNQQYRPVYTPCNDYSTFPKPEPKRITNCNDAATRLFPNLTIHGDPYFEQILNVGQDRSISFINDLNDDFWIHTLEHTMYMVPESLFRQYNEGTGIYEPISEQSLITTLSRNLERAAFIFPGNTKYHNYKSLVTRKRLASMIEKAKLILAMTDNPRLRELKYVYFSNGRYNLGDRTFEPYTPQHLAFSKFNVAYDPNANCDLFKRFFINGVLSEEDVEALQLYLSMLLDGHNYAQKILVLTGESGWGKSTVMNIVCKLLGWNKIGVLRPQVYSDSQELSHYQGKHLLYHPDMPSNFLNHPHCGIFKQLVGGDPITIEDASGKRAIMEGSFPVILACNGTPQINLDQDTEAWARRLIILKFKKPNHEDHMGKLGDLMANEGSGILNWLLEGRRKLRAHKLQINLTREQQVRTNTLLMASDSPTTFVQEGLEAEPDTIIGVTDMYQSYKSWCRDHEIAPTSSKEFTEAAKQQLEQEYGLRYRHDLPGATGIMRGWKGVKVKNAENGSDGSGNCPRPCLN